MTWLRCVTVPTHSSGGLYLSSMPGREEPLENAMCSIQEGAIDLVVCLAPEQEIEAKSPEYAQALREDRLPFLVRRFAIRDLGVPETIEERERYRELAHSLANCIADGQRILVHCGAGVGRTGTLAAAVLISLGIPKDQALELVELAGSGPETRAQHELLCSIGE